MAASSNARSCGNIKSKAAAGRKDSVTAAPYGTSLLLPLLFVIALLCVQSTVHASATCNAGDRAALLQFKSELVDQFNLLSDWNSTNPNCCTWAEQYMGTAVTCNSQGRVTSLLLSGRVATSSGYTATLVRNTSYNAAPFAASLGSLTDLQKIEIDFVGFNGVGIPSSWSNLKQLTFLDLTFADLVGGLSSSLVSNWNLLQTLDLQGDGFSGPLPADLCTSQGTTTITSFQINENNFSGPIPPCLSTFSSSAFQPGNTGLCGAPLPACT
ncbi:hypothetical protein BDL97_15G021300 [Sphagnum fallax]|jgi:EIX receptor 1/2|nr:hypothetical protein BDL97_15G021300 [Sphagnum fallax]